jgi:hypothetical protein
MLIKGFLHVYANELGLEIAVDQIHRIERRGLLNKSVSLNVGIVGETTIQPENPRVKVFHSYNKEWYEGWTLTQLYEDACKATEETFYYYLHTKGASRKKGEADSWRNEMERIIIDHHMTCIYDLLTKDIGSCGPMLFHNPRPFYAGNFWWATSEHVKLCMPPYDYMKMKTRSGDLHPRYPYEEWITMGIVGQTAEEQEANLKAYSKWTGGGHQEQPK